MQSLDKLNNEFAVNGHLEFKEGPSGFILADIKNESAGDDTVTISPGEEHKLRLNVRVEAM